MHHISSRATPVMTTIEVDGDLDAVSAYDLQCRVDTAIGLGVHRVGLDLSRVSSVDDTGIHGLIRVCNTAVGVGMTLSMTGCSRPTLVALRRFQARQAQR